jgi:hypothetical protein
VGDWIPIQYINASSRESTPVILWIFTARHRMEPAPRLHRELRGLSDQRLGCVTQCGWLACSAVRPSHRGVRDRVLTDGLRRTEPARAKPVRGPRACPYSVSIQGARACPYREHGRVRTGSTGVSVQGARACPYREHGRVRTARTDGSTHRTLPLSPRRAGSALRAKPSRARAAAR